jgi:type IV secretory pathway VirB2 component (pilin)
MFVTLPRIASTLPSIPTGARPGPRLHAAAAIAGTLAPSLLPGLALAQAVGEPAGSGPLVAALQWVEGTLLGNLATTAAVIAVAVVGLMMLTGRIDWRRGLTVILGAFIVFGAVAIVSGIRSVASGAR